MFLKNTYYFTILFVVALVLATGSCKKAPNYSDVPAIEFKSLTFFSDSDSAIYGDSVYLKISFTDGNGDLGNDPANETDFFSIIQKKQDGIFTDIIDETGLGDGNLPLLSPYTSPGPIDGTITNNTCLLYRNPSAIPEIQKGDTLRFNIRIQDRAGNYSNWVTSSEMVVWQGLAPP